MPADYDGDGDAEVAVWRAVESTWYVRGSAPVQFGRPVTAQGITDVPARNDLLSVFYLGG